MNRKLLILILEFFKLRIVNRKLFLLKNIYINISVKFWQTLIFQSAKKKLIFYRATERRSRDFPRKILNVPLERVFRVARPPPILIDIPIDISRQLQNIFEPNITVNT